MYKYENDQYHLERFGELAELNGPIAHSSELVSVAYAEVKQSDGSVRIQTLTHGTPEGMKIWLDAHHENGGYPAKLYVFPEKTSVDIINSAVVDDDVFAKLLNS